MQTVFCEASWLVSQRSIQGYEREVILRTCEWLVVVARCADGANIRFSCVASKLKYEAEQGEALEVDKLDVYTSSNHDIHQCSQLQSRCSGTRKESRCGKLQRQARLRRASVRNTTVFRASGIQ